ncbi:beta-lactamase family protein [Herbiconiux sp. CPCC 205763]|uniref:Beta-lactamase family protein n=1 Tax=Herbiconiux aconitum TaxID=2970913 RepID=A0ABT2GRX1_9MICO|nr:serine hydrolase domain-containing protein [Herbiconiux aconitum]MCS5718976.1 beta-lactamase family protein [Herbiconiux aconitum]
MRAFDEVRQSLEQCVADGYAPGIVAGIRHRGETEYFATGRYSFDPGSPPMTTGTPFRVASLGKLVAGALSTMLLGEGVFALDDPIDRWLPEVAEPRVLVSPDATLDETVPAHRPITVSDLLTMTAGFAFPFPETPLTRAMADAGVATGPVPAQLTPDEFAARLGSLPLARQPGDRFAYDTAADVLSILLARASGGTLGDLVRTRVADPLGLASTTFFVPGPLPTPYRVREGAPGNGAEAATMPADLVVAEGLVTAFSHPPLMESLRGGLVSTVPEFLRFLVAVDDDALLTRAQRIRMTSDQLTDGQRIGLAEMGGPGYGWGWQTGVDLLPRPGESLDADAFRAVALAEEPWRSPGRWGWAGGTGTSAYVDPDRDLVAAVFTQHQLGAPTDDFSFFWRPLIASVGSRH